MFSPALILSDQASSDMGTKNLVLGRSDFLHPAVAYPAPPYSIPNISSMISPSRLLFLFKNLCKACWTVPFLMVRKCSAYLNTSYSHHFFPVFTVRVISRSIASRGKSPAVSIADDSALK